MAVRDYSSSPGENTSISGINIAEGCPPGNVNNAIRQMMADLKTMASGEDSGKAPTSHASANTTYGVGTGGMYGHVKLSDYANEDNGVSQGIAATPKCVQTVKDGLETKITAANTNIATVTGTANTALANAATAQSTAESAATSAGAKAPISHASANTTYGVGAGGAYGHVKLSDYANDGNGVSQGIAATPKCVQAARDAATAAIASVTSSVTAVDTKADNRLPLSGGTMSGAITRTLGNGANALLGDVNTSYMNVCGGNGYTKGASLQLFGMSHASSPGNFVLRAHNAAGNHCELVGTASGALTWNGNDISTAADTIGTGYVKYANGTLICYGQTPGLNVESEVSSQRTFGHAFKQATTPTVVVSVADADEHYEQASWRISYVTNTVFTVSAKSHGANMAKNVKFNWIAIGVWK